MKKLSVYLTQDREDSRLVGELAESDRKIYFEYDSEFLQNPLWLSPFKLPPESGLHEHTDRAFGPLFGLFDDSLPDGWGLLLMDRVFRKQGVDLNRVSPLDRLAYMGDHTMGALTYRPPCLRDEPDGRLMDFHSLASESYQVLAGKSESILAQLVMAGGSPGGARPKVLVGLNGDEMIAGVGTLPDGYQYWMVKFYSREEAVDEGLIEQAYSQMARAAGLSMPTTRLFETKEGDSFFGVERFDRQGCRRVHMQTFGNLIHANFRIPGSDYEQLLKVTRILTKNQEDLLSAFRLMVFNIVAHNRDDHVKNFSFILEPNMEWTLAPAYDLTFSPGPGGEHTLTVAGEGREPRLSHVLHLAGGAGITRKQAMDIIDEVTSAVTCWPRFAKEVDLSRKSTQRITQATQACLLRIKG